MSRHQEMCICNACKMKRQAMLLSPGGLPLLGVKPAAQTPLNVQVAYNDKNNRVRLSFGAKISFLEMNKDNALEIARVLIESAGKIQ